MSTTGSTTASASPPSRPARTRHALSVRRRWGRLLGEYGASAAAPVAETIWLSPEVANDNQPMGGDDGVGGYAPLAVAVGSGSGLAMQWIHGSHLGVPLVTTNASGVAIVPTGYMMPGFPGQTKTLSDIYYNRYRDYDSSTGRYIQADPIGLEGGANPFLYAKGNPLRYTDPSGKCPMCAAIIIGAAIGGGSDLLIQAGSNWFHGRDILNPACYNWSEVGVSALLGATGGGLSSYARAAESLAVEAAGTASLNPANLAGKTAAEIDAAAQNAGLIPKGPSPMTGEGAYIDSVTGEQRVLIHPDAEAPHIHVNDPTGARLDINGNVVPPESPAAHLPLGGN